MKKFTLGVAAGMSSLALAVPVMAQIAGAQSSGDVTQSSSAGAPFFFEAFMHKSFTQEDVEKMIEQDNAFLSNIDAFIALQKSAIQTHRIALTAAADITDDAERQEAVRAAHEAMRTTIHEAVEKNPDLAAAMHHGMGKAHHIKMRGPGMFIEKLGMTPEELKTALESGKTIEEIAEEKGIELPVRIEKHMDRGFFEMRADAPSSAQ